MATDLHIISNFSSTKEDILKNKEVLLEKIKQLGFQNIEVPRYNPETKTERFESLKGKWEIELPYGDEEYPAEVIYIGGPFPFCFYFYESCLCISTIHRYSYLYCLNEYKGIEVSRRFIFKTIKTFGCTEIIYLADNGCDKLGDYLLKVEVEGYSYHQIKNEIEKSKISIISDYSKLDYNKLNWFYCKFSGKGQDPHERTVLRF